MATNVLERLPDEELCKKYAQFASGLDRWHFKIMYWTLFIFNMFILFMASYIYIKAEAMIKRYEKDDMALGLRRNKRLLLLLFGCSACVVVSTVIVIIEAFAIMALQFCDGEDLISLYWSTWTMVQLGSLIAMVGIILALIHSVRNREVHPPWALALGTPVLVIAGILHLIHDCTKNRIRGTCDRRGSADSACETTISDANTIRGEADLEEGIGGEIVGFAIDGGPIIRLNQPVSNPIPHSQLLGMCPDQRPIVILNQGAVQALETPRAEARQAEKVAE